MSNNYIFLDATDRVVNVALMANEPVSQEVLDLLMAQNNAVRVLRFDDGSTCVNTCETITPTNNPDIGSTYIDGRFLPDKPGENYILDISETFWVPIPPDPDTATNTEYHLDVESGEWV